MAGTPIGFQNVGAVLRKRGNGQSIEYAVNPSNAAAVGAAMEQAHSDASSGDYIGVYAPATLTTALGKDGVNWWVSPGITITQTTNGTPVFDLSSAMSFYVGGGGIFGTTDYFPIQIGHASAILYFRGSQIGVTGNSGAIYMTAGLFKGTVDGDVIGDQSDCLSIQGGTIDIECKDLVTVLHSIQVKSGATAKVRARNLSGGTDGSGVIDWLGLLQLDCQLITGDSSKNIQIDIGSGGSSTPSGYISCPTILGAINTNAGSVGTARIIGSYIAPNKTNGDAVIVNENGLVLQDCTIQNNGSGKAFKQPATGSKTIVYFGCLSYVGTKDGNVTLQRGPTSATNLP